MIDKIRDVEAKTVLNYSAASSLSDEFFIFNGSAKDGEVSNRLVVTTFPVRLDINISIVCEEGFISINIGYDNYIIRKNDFISILPNKVTQVVEISDDFRAKIICVKPGFFDFNKDQHSFNVQNIIREYPYHTLPVDKMDFFTFLFNYVESIMGDKNNIYRKQIAHSFLNMMFYEISNLLLIETENYKKNTTNPNEEIFRKFVADIEANFQKERTIKFYANKACLTPKYFSTLIFRLTGKHAKEWIDEYTILDAKALLKSTNMNIQQISYELNFATPSHFGRYFKHYTGISPLQYRNS